MLRDVSLFLAQHENTVSVVGRNQERLDQLVKDAAGMKGRVNPLRMDYRDINDVKSQIEAAIEKFGPVILVVNWMEPDALDASDSIAELLEATSPICRYFQVLTAGPDALADDRYFTNPYQNHNRILYRTVSLGHQLEKGGLSRLSNPKEVCEGIIDAIRNDRRNAVIGTTETLGVRSQSA